MAAEAEQQHCRIGKVRFKSGGEMTVLRQPAIGEVSKKLVEATRNLVTEYDIIGYVIVAVISEDSTRTSFYAPDHIPTRCLPSFVEETVRQSMWK